MSSLHPSRLIHSSLSRSFVPVVAVVLLAGCGHSNESGTDPRTQPPLVRSATVKLADVPSVRYTGTVAARAEADLSFRVSGKIIARPVDRGQRVKQGESLMRLDPDDLALEQNAKRESVSAARARARQTQDDLARYRDLRGSGAISESAYDRIKSAAESAQADLNAAEASARVAGNAKDYAELIAARDGMVMDVMAEPGEVVSPGQPVIRFARTGPREAKVQLPETLRPAIGSVAQGSLYGRPDQMLVTRLRVLSHSADPATRTYEARYVFDDEAIDAPLGATVTVRIPTPRKPHTNNTYAVPLLAINDFGDGSGIWIVGSNIPHKVRWQSVTIRRISDETAVVTGDLKAGQAIVALGADRLRAGQTVRLAETSESTDGMLERE